MAPYRCLVRQRKNPSGRFVFEMGRPQRARRALLPRPDERGPSNTLHDPRPGRRMVCLGCLRAGPCTAHPGAGRTGRLVRSTPGLSASSSSLPGMLSKQCRSVLGNGPSRCPRVRHDPGTQIVPGLSFIGAHSYLHGGPNRFRSPPWSLSHPSTTSPHARTLPAPKVSPLL